MTEAIVRSVCGDIPVVITSIVDGTGLNELVDYVGAGRTLALIGASGVGKSALVNTLVGEELLEVGSVSAMSMPKVGTQPPRGSSCCCLAKLVLCWTHLVSVLWGFGRPSTL